MAKIILMKDEKRKRGRPRLAAHLKKCTDERKVFKSEPLFFEGAFVGTFEGKMDPNTKILKIYKYYGDITKFSEAIQDYALDNQIPTVITTFHY